VRLELVKHAAVWVGAGLGPGEPEVWWLAWRQAGTIELRGPWLAGERGSRPAGAAEFAGVGPEFGVQRTSTSGPGARPDARVHGPGTGGARSDGYSTAPGEFGNAWAGRLAQKHVTETKPGLEMGGGASPLQISRSRLTPQHGHGPSASLKARRRSEHVEFGANVWTRRTPLRQCLTLANGATLEVEPGAVLLRDRRGQLCWTQGGFGSLRAALLVPL
jgi:hypothetical protein